MVVQSQFIEMFRTAPKEHVHLKDIATYSIGLTYKPENVKPSGIPVLRSGNIQEESLDFGDLVRVDSSIPDTLLLQDGDILMCSRNGSAHLVGKVARIRQLPEPMTYGAFMTVIRSEYMDYLFLFFQSDGFRQQISYGKSSTMNQITQKMLDQITLDLPSKTEIEKLSPLLEQADKSKFDGLKSQFIEMFGDPITNSKECVVKKGYELFAFSSGKANTRANLNDSYKYDCYGGNGTTGKSKEYLIDYSTLVIGRVGEYCGSVHCTPTYSWITDNAIYIKEFNDKDLDINYLYYLFLFLDLHRFSAKTGQPKITQEALLGIDYICPGIEEQEKYVTFAHQADKSKYLS